MNPSRYRYVNWIGDRILEARELITYEDIMHGVDSSNTRTAYDLNALYFEGATFNITPVVTPNATTVTLTPTNPSNPMLVFVRGRWEILESGEAAPVTFPYGQSTLYLNWQLLIRTNADDPSLVDGATGEPTAQMGELSLQVSNIDTSAAALNTSTQFDKNTTPVVLFTFAAAGNSLTLVSSTSVNGQALASKEKGGFVFLTTDTSAGTAASSDDSRLSDERIPLDNSVTDVKVTTPTPNPSGNYVSVSGGGISDAKVVHLPTSQTTSAAIESTRATANAAQAAITGHINQPLGPGIHPMPTATQVGAAPLSHVSLPLGVSGSHPPQVNADSGGFSVIRDPGAAAAAMDPALGVLMAGVLQAGLLHNGDVYSLLANTQVANPLVESGDPALTSGTLGLVSHIAAVLSQHVNKTSHKNPHGLALSDLGGIPTTAFTSGSNANGYWTKDPTGKIDQWGIVSNANDGQTVSFPKSFTNLASVSVTTQIGFDPSGSNYAGVSGPYQGTVTLNGFGLANKNFDGHSGPTNITIYWIAVGY